MTKERGTVLIVEARFYDEIADNMATSIIAELEKAGYSYERIEVPGVFEVPAAVLMGMESDRAYAGAIALGCVIRGETDHYDHICREASRALMDLSIAGVPLGFGILTCENYDQAMARADINRKNKGKEVADACLRMMELEELFDGSAD